jgi:RNA polymerase-binding transcription factor DksA
MDTSHFAQRLEEEKTTLERELATVGRRNPSNPADWEPVPGEVGQEADVVDQASVLDSLGENTAILNDLEIRYHTVLDALARIANGTYGICSVGGEAIEEARLEADPAATTCVAHLS